MVRDRSSGNIHIVPTSYIISALWRCSLYTIVQFYTESFPPGHREDNQKFFWSTILSWRNEEIHSLNPALASFFWHNGNEETREFSPEETKFWILITNQHQLNGLQANFSMSLHPVNFDRIWRTNPFPRIKKYYSHFKFFSSTTNDIIDHDLAAQHPTTCYYLTTMHILKSVYWASKNGRIK